MGNFARIVPIPPEQRVDTRLYEMFFVWFSANMNILRYAGTSMCQQLSSL
jgi:hypothetical protein